MRSILQPLFSRRDKMLPMLPALFMCFQIAVTLKFGDISNHLDYTYNETISVLEKRGLHEEDPLIFVADDHPLEYYWTRPEFPSRK